MTKFRALVALPLFFLMVLAFHQIGADRSQAATQPMKAETEAVTPAKTARKVAKKEPEKSAADQIIHRRIRIEGLLTNLDHVAAVALQMKPEESDRLEPIIVDLAERTLELVDAEQLADPSSDRELDDLESTLKGLMEAVTRQVATETTL